MSTDLNAPEVQDAIKKAQEEVRDELSGLVEKNKQLLGEVKNLRKQAEIKPEDLEAVEAERDKYKAELDKANKSVKDMTKQVETMQKSHDGETAFTRKLLVDNGLSAELMKAGVTNPVHLKAVKSMLQNQVEIVTENDDRIAKVGDKPLGEFITEWAKGDEAKFFIAADNNGGGGSNGSGDGSGHKQNLTSTGKIAEGLRKRQG